MIKAIQIPFYNKIQAAKPATNPYAPSFKSALERQPNNDSFVKQSFGARKREKNNKNNDYVYLKTQAKDGTTKLERTKVNIERSKAGRYTTFNVTYPGGKRSLGSITVMKQESLKGDQSKMLVNSLYSLDNSGYKGVGSVLMKQALQESIKEGCEGRLSLNAYHSGERGSPTPFYYKIGFRFPKDKNNEQMERFLEQKSKDKNTELPDSIKAGGMYLPKENIPVLLAQPMERALEEIQTDEIRLRNEEGEAIPVNIKREVYSNTVVYEISNANDDSPLGYIDMTNFKNGPKHHEALFINKIYSREREKYKGVGTVLMHCAFKESVKQGYGGRLSVYSLATPSPSPFAYKLGLRFKDDELNKKMEKHLTAEARGENPQLDEDLESGRMYLFEENFHLLLERGEKHD